MILERERPESWGRERDIDLLFHFCMHLFVDSYMYPDRGLNPQTWCNKTTLQLTELPGQGKNTYFLSLWICLFWTFHKNKIHFKNSNKSLNILKYLVSVQILVCIINLFFNCLNQNMNSDHTLWLIDILLKCLSDLIIYHTVIYNHIPYNSPKENKLIDFSVFTALHPSPQF